MTAVTATHKPNSFRYASVVNINAYHQPGVEAGKKSR
jgi:glucose-6-phosphate isomerase